MPYVHRTKLWQVTLPDAWRAGGGGPLVTIWNPEGVGTISVLSTDENKAPPRSGTGKEFRGKLIGRAFEHKAREHFARHWHLLCGDRWIYVTYFCSARNAASERAEVDEILRSISEVV
jgi:hypothetical protein